VGKAGGSPARRRAPGDHLRPAAHAALRCVTACLEDFRGDLATISIPVLVIHGDQDRALPYEATSSRLPALLQNARSTVIAGGPHAIISRTDAGCAGSRGQMAVRPPSAAMTAPVM
jgi:pimeloyl-ACP methyl ester carboxylesterase